ncbi:unnamed protein product [Closterium sp. Yama58-4]|nr:unnamed protein product [Closterium sp. Yama58-4]
MSLLGVYKHILEGLKSKLSEATLRELDASLERITQYSRQSFFRIPAHTAGYFSGHNTFKAFHHQAVMQVLPALLVMAKVEERTIRAVELYCTWHREAWHRTYHTDASLANLDEMAKTLVPMLMDEFTVDDQASNFNVPKIHAMLHVTDDIRQRGVPIHYCTDVYEHVHVALMKRPYRASNKRNAEASITRRCLVSELVEWMSAKDEVPDAQERSAALQQVSYGSMNACTCNVDVPPYGYDAMETGISTVTGTTMRFLLGDERNKNYLAYVMSVPGEFDLLEESIVSYLKELHGDDEVEYARMIQVHAGVAVPPDDDFTRAQGRPYATEAARFDEEARAEPDVNEELRSEKEKAKAIAGVYQKENGRLADDLKSALVLLTHLAKKVQQVDQSALDWKKYIKEACDDFLFKRVTLNLNPDVEAMLNALIGWLAEGLQVAVFAKSQGKLKDASERFNDRIGKIYRFCRCYALSREPCIFMREKRTAKGELTFAELDDFEKLCANYVKNNSDSKSVTNCTIIPPAFIKCATLWDPEFDGTFPIPLFSDQLLVILAAVRFKLRYPHSKAQFKRSGDPAAFSRQARVVQRWINETEVIRDGDCVGIGKICIVRWREIPEAELEADELGDLTLEEVTSRASYRRVYNENEVQKEMF